MREAVLKSETDAGIDSDFQRTGLEIMPLQQLAWLGSMKSVVQRHFAEPDISYFSMDDEGYREHAAACQKELNVERPVEGFVRSHFDYLSKLVGPRISFQSELYLRCTRPKQINTQEHVGWHRETFYGPQYIGRSINIWIPLVEITPDNALYFVPESHRIPGDKIETQSLSGLNGGVARFSAGHRIGLLYAPKTIVGGVDLENAKPLLVPQGSFGAFSALMIHGNAANTTDSIRFSVDFRVIATEDITQAQSNNFSSGTEYFNSFV